MYPYLLLLHKCKCAQEPTQNARYMPYSHAKPLVPSHMIPFPFHIWALYSTASYHLNLPFSPFAAPSSGFVTGSLSSLNPKFLNSSLAIRFLHHTISEVSTKRHSGNLHTCPFYTPDTTSPDSCTRDRSSP